MKDKYLPAGSVVRLKGAEKRLLITGFCAVSGEKPDSMYDYSGCAYPEGFITYDQIALFNHDQIETIYHEGFIDDEELAFKKDLEKLVGNSKNNKN